MALRRKPNFCSCSDLLPIRAYPPVTINGSAETDYCRLRSTSDGWIGKSLQDRDRIVRVEDVPQMTISDFGTFVDIHHINVARFFGLYYNQESTDVVFEYTDLDLLAVFPLNSEAEVASMVAQVLRAINHLLSQPTDLRIMSIRLSMFGLIKLTLDFRHRPTTDIIHKKEMYRSMVSYIEQMMKISCPHMYTWTFDAADFLDILYSGDLPPASHPFLRKSRGPAGLRGPAQVAMRTLIAMASV